MINLTPFFILALPFVLSFLETRNWKKTLNNLFGKLNLPKAVLRAAYLLTAILLVLFVLSAVFSLLGISDSKVAQFISKADPLTILLAVTIAPLGEELLFRAFLQSKIGVLFSSGIFAALHYAYGSWTEIAAAFVISLVIGLEYRRNKDVYACFIGHAAYNLFSVATVLLLLK